MTDQQLILILWAIFVSRATTPIINALVGVALTVLLFFI